MMPSRKVPHPSIFIINSAINAPFIIEKIAIFTVNLIDRLTETRNNRLIIADKHTHFHFCCTSIALLQVDSLVLQPFS